MCGGRACAYGSADQDSRTAPDQSAHQHARARATGDFDLIPPVMPASLEEPFLVYVRSRDVGVHQNSVQHEALPVGQDHVLGQNSNAGLAFDSARFAELGDAPSMVEPAGMRVLPSITT